MKKRLSFIGVTLLFFGAVWYGIWYAILTGDVAQIKATIAYQQEQFARYNASFIFTSGEVERSGFPFDFQVTVHDLVLSSKSQQESYSVSVPELTFERVHHQPGFYEITPSQKFSASYAGRRTIAPSSYTLKLANAADLQLKVDQDKCKRSAHPRRCAQTMPLSNYSMQFPDATGLDIKELNGNTSHHFTIDMVDANAHDFERVPGDMDYWLETFIDVIGDRSQNDRLPVFYDHGNIAIHLGNFIIHTDSPVIHSEPKKTK